MKKIFLSFLLLAFMLVAVGQPADTFARGGADDRELKVEADVFTDITIVKVELPAGKKYTFSTEADTEADIVDIVVEKFDLVEAEVTAALELEVKDRASRTNERAKIKDREKVKLAKDRVKVCKTDTSAELEVEATVFTDTTIVKVELASGTKQVFETEATSTEAIAEAVADRYDLDEAAVKAVLELEVKDRASKTADRAVAYNPADCDDDRAMIGKGNGSSTPRDADLRAQVAELQRLLNTLMALFKQRFGDSI